MGLEVELLSHTHYPVGVLLRAWMMNRGVTDKSPEDWECFLNGDDCIDWRKVLPEARTVSEARKLAKEMVRTIVEDNLPPCELIEFVWGLHNVAIAFREQLVRHRVGTKMGGSDWIWTIPDLHTSSYWVQSSRAINFSDFTYFMPAAVLRDPKLREEYKEAMEHIREHYKRLLAMGVPVEDARYILPLGMQHDLVWATNLRSLHHILQARSCWLAQTDLWGPVIQSIARHLHAVSPLLGVAAKPPCYRRGSFHKCPYLSGVEERIKGADPNPPCPLAMVHEHTLEPHHDPKQGWTLLGNDRKLSNWQAPNEESARRLTSLLGVMGSIWGEDYSKWEARGGTSKKSATDRR